MAGKDGSLSDYMKANASYKMNLIRSSIPQCLIKKDTERGETGVAG